MTASIDCSTERPPVSAAPRWNTDSLREERHELFESVMQSMGGAEPDPDRLAACAYLLRHLARTSAQY